MKYQIILVIVILLSGCSHKISRQVQVQKTDEIKTVSSTVKIDNKTISDLKTSWQNEYVTADGFAPVISKYPDEARNLMLAKRAAVVDAQRNLAEKVNEVRLNATTTMADFQAVDFVQSRISARLKETEVISEFHNKDKSIFEVRIQMPKWEIISIMEEYVK